MKTKTKTVTDIQRKFSKVLIFDDRNKHPVRSAYLKGNHNKEMESRFRRVRL